MNIKNTILAGSLIFLSIGMHSRADTFDSAVTIEPSYYGPKLILNDSNSANKVPIEFRSNNNIKWELGQRPVSQNTDMVFWRFRGSSYIRTMTWSHVNGNVGIGNIVPSAKLHVNAGHMTSDAFVFEGSHPSTSKGLDLTIRSTSGAFPLLKLANVYRNSFWNIENGRYGSGEIGFYKSGLGTAMLIDGSGNLGIGTTTPDFKLDVNGTMRAKEVIVETDWSDFVFEDSYQLRSLDEVENHIAKHGHLPDVPPASIIESDGLSVGEAQKIMMQKIEELTLYLIEQEKKNEAQQILIEKLQGEITTLKI